jgi:hypothetical protein
MRCPRCKNKVVQQLPEAVRVRLEGPIELTAEACRAKCYWCKTPIDLPLILDPTKVLMKYVLPPGSGVTKPLSEK